jgi:ABC-type uncharacterized transport system substrate-binding protein
MAALRSVRAVCLGVAAAIFAIPQSAEAHPHVWVTVETEIQTDAAKNVTGFRHKWRFDEFYSSFATQGLDKNGDGQFQPEELKELAEVNITSLKEFGFFTFPRLSGQEIDRLEPRDYTLEHANGVLTLNFTLPLKEPVAHAKLKDFEFAVYDPTMYVGFAFAKEKAIRMAAGASDCKAEIAGAEAQAPAKSLSESLFSNMDKLTNFGQQYAETVRVKCPAAS